MNRKIRTLFLLGYLPEPRMYNRMKAAKEYSQVSLICWDRGVNMYARPEIKDIDVTIIDIPAVNNPLKRLIPYVKFKRIARKKIYAVNPDIIHVRNLDMLEIACDYKNKHPQTIVIYEVADIHRILVDKQKSLMGKIAQKYLLAEDIRCGKKSDILIVSSEKYYEEYFYKFFPKNRAVFIPNVPDLSVFDTYQKKSIEDPLVVGFIGAIRYKKQMDNLFIAAKKCGMKLLIAGYENDGNELEKKWSSDPDVEWVGKFDFDKQVAELYGKCNIMYSVYDADMENVRVALPNKLYEAAFCEMPLIVAKGTFLAETVEEWGTGVAVDHKEPDELIAVLERFKKDPMYFSHFDHGYQEHKEELDIRRYNTQLRAMIESVLKEKKIV